MHKEEDLSNQLKSQRIGNVNMGHNRGIKNRLRSKLLKCSSGFSNIRLGL